MDSPSPHPDVTVGSAAPARDLVILGSTGSIGTQAVDVVLRDRERFRVVALAAGASSPDSVRLLARQTIDLEVEYVAVARVEAVEAFRAELAAESARRGSPCPQPKILAGPTAATEAAALDCDAVLNAVTGAIGLEPTLAALAAGRRLLLANKESLIIGGPLVKRLAAPGQLIPVDSEHSALAQCLRGGRAEEVQRLVVTASGGPFRGWSRERLRQVTPEQALNHPTWSMGPVITVNSATLVNKGLEVIEAHLLFDVPFDRIDVVVHPQSVVHSMVEFTDGSTLAQASPPDMRLPIALAMGWPDRVAGAAAGCDWSTATSWEFFPLDDAAFPAVRLARQVGAAGSTHPAVYNAANEVCVSAFLTGRLPFTGIVDTVERVVSEHAERSRHDPAEALRLADVLAADAWARERARDITEERPHPGGPGNYGTGSITAC